MEFIEQSAVLEDFNGQQIMKKLERIGRICYKSEDKITEDSADGFIRRIIKSGHESIIEHVSITAYLTLDRAIAQELTRHRLGSYTHESTRYVDYQDRPMRFIPKLGYDEGYEKIVKKALTAIEKGYKDLREAGVMKQDARDLLPLGYASDLVATYNLREWRHIMKLRYSCITGSAHPKIIALMEQMLIVFKEKLPVIFEDIPLRN